MRWLWRQIKRFWQWQAEQDRKALEADPEAWRDWMRP